MEETCYNRAKLAADHEQSVILLNSEQLEIHNCILSSYQRSSQVLLFVYGHGGTGKTFLWTTIISFFRSIGKIVLAVAASGIASLLLPSERTAHSRFKIPIDLTDQSTCHVKKGTHLADLLNQTLLIIWDEAPMSDRRCFECLDKTLRDITGDSIHPFGGKSVLLGGDFRQTLPVKVKCTRSEIIDSKLPRSYLWQHFRIFRLRENMRLRSHREVSDSTDLASQFASWLLSIGDDLLGEQDVKDPQNTRHVQIPTQYLIDASENKLISLIYFIYDRSTLNNPSPGTLSTRAIVCPTNDTSDEINKLVLTLTPGDCKVYSSYDVMVPHSGNHTDLEALYPQEYLNQLSFPGMPPHELTLKINTPIILIRNINQTLGLCNGTRLIVTQLLTRIIEAQIITGTSGKKEELCYQFVDIYGDGIEATAEVKHIEYFDSLIQLRSCYKVNRYICTGARTYMATVEHVASLVIGQKTVFEPVTNLDIPSVYFNFATYETIKTRIKDSKLLTDYIGRVEKNSLRSTSTGIQLRKTLIQDDMGNAVEITLWPEMRHLIGDEVIAGDIVAITSTMVTEYNGRVQLESTYLTTTAINPDVPQTVEHISRLRALPTMQSAATEERLVTLLDLKLSSQQNIQASRNFMCDAKITQIHEDRGWYYVLCSKCSSKLYPQQDSDNLIFVCKDDDDDDVSPNFRYCVNASITDETGSSDAVFFNDSMQEMLNISCGEMATKYANTANPRAVPQELKSAVDTPRRLHLTLKNDGKIVVNNVSKGSSATDRQSTSRGTPTFTPATPIAIAVTSKRQLTKTPGQTKKFKQP
ncbi:hypothetical protein CASFOL_002026 [Castilleja foliolosa]|uniref:ATP-dependent DNA helicase n=1 Tax=Castilleja foliolosa TaxID=1961234 RepID=A0ABD3EGT5_9LAMI